MGFNTLVLAQQTTDTIQVGSTQTAHSQNSHNTEAQACTVVKDTLQAPRVLPSLKREKQNLFSMLQCCQLLLPSVPYWPT